MNRRTPPLRGEGGQAPRGIPWSMMKAGGRSEPVPFCRLRSRRRGMLLVVVLAIIAMLAILGASFAFQMNAQVAKLQAERDLQQARLAADSGIDRAISILRDKRTDMDEWYNNPAAFRRILVWAPDKIGGSESLADQEAIPGQPAWRFSLVSYRLQGNDNTAKMRYGLTDEAGKVNLNTAPRAQLLLLFDEVKHEDVTSEQLADAVIDWRDKDDEAGPEGAESEYYATLNPPYKAKNRPLDTVEELLMVKGFNGRILYGEDYNRNGYLDPNEDDGPEGTFPPDDGDGRLNRGLLPLTTIYSWDWNFANDNKPRVDLNTTSFKDTSKLPDEVVNEISPEILDFIAKAQQRGHKFQSVGELYQLEVYEDGSSNYDRAWKQYRRYLKEGGRFGRQELEAEDLPEEAPGEDGPQGGDRGQDQNPQDPNPQNPEMEQPGPESDQPPPGVIPPENLEDQSDPKNQGRQNKSILGSKNSGRLNQSAGGRGRGGSGRSFGAPGRRNEEEESRRDQENQAGESDDPGSNEAESADETSGEEGRRDGRRGQGRRGQPRQDENAPGDQPPEDETPPWLRDGEKPPEGENQDGVEPDGDSSGQQDQTGQPGQTGQLGGAQGPGGGRGSGLRPGETLGTGRGRGTPIISPVRAEDMIGLLDRLAITPIPALPGLVNVNTAPVEALKSLPGLTGEQAEAIVARRDQMTGAEKATPAWLLTSGAVDPVAFALISNQITTRSIQFTIDAIGFADHVGAYKRIQAVVEMRGQVSQIKYYRDISSLGLGFPIRDDQRSEGFAFSDN